MEISRCEQLKLLNMRQVIVATRQQLTEWWDKCYYSQEQRAQFKPYFTGKSWADVLLYPKLHGIDAKANVDLGNEGIMTMHCDLAEEFTEEMLELHDQELTAVRQYYTENQEMLEKVARRQQLWDEFMEFEVR